MRQMSPRTLPLTRNKQPRPASRPDVRLTILVSFAAGILLGIPLTFGALFLGTFSSAPVVISPHPAGTRLFPARESGPGNNSTAASSRQTAAESLESPYSTTRVADRRKSLPRRGGDVYRTTIGRPSDVHRATIERPIDVHTTAIGHPGDFHRTTIGHPGNVHRTWNFLKSRPSEKVFEKDRIFDGIFWTELAESYVPKGFGEEDSRQWREFLNATAVVKVEEGCGRMQNRLVTLSDGRMSCCRYRHNNDQIQGEIFSFYLGRILEMENLAPSALSLVDPRSGRWSRAASQMSLARWNPERPAVLTQFVEELRPAYVPEHFRDSKSRKGLHPLAEHFLNVTSRDEVAELVQWSDLIVFDYLTANLDRVVNNMYNERWNPGMMSHPTHNLAKTPQGLLLFLDNESGLLHGYRLLEKYEHFHKSLLDSLCLFRKRTVRAVEQLHRRGDIDSLLKSAFAERDPGMSEWLPFLPDRSIRTLKERLFRVLEQVRKCKGRFERVTDS